MSRPNRLTPCCVALTVALALSGAGCKTPTEVVIRLSTAGATTSPVDVRLHRSQPFNDVPAGAPAFVTPFLDGADLVLELTPQASDTVMSLLPPKTAPLDLTVTVSASGYAVDPATPQDGSFVEHVAKELRFTLSALPPDMSVLDKGKPKDLSSPPVDNDAAPPVTDLAPLFPGD